MNQSSQDRTIKLSVLIKIHFSILMVQTLQARADAAPTTAPPVAETINNRRDLGEYLKPPLPEPFKGHSADVLPFLTRMKGYFRMFPNKLDSAEKKMLATAPLIQGDAKDWFEPMWKDFLENDYDLQDQETQNEPQMAIRTQTLGMCRGGYDMANKTALTQQPQTANWENHHAESSTRKPGEYFESKEEIQRKWENPERTPKQEKTRQYNLKHSATDEAREAARLRTQRSRAKKREGETQTLGVMTTPTTPSNEASKAIDDIPRTAYALGNNSAPAAWDTEEEQPELLQETSANKTKKLKTTGRNHTNLYMTNRVYECSQVPRKGAYRTQRNITTPPLRTTSTFEHTT
ncbi:unnamed protein product [Fusarium graminearum]|nr:unnamed protein product [Fusarium graminearum]